MRPVIVVPDLLAAVDLGTVVNVRRMHAVRPPYAYEAKRSLEAGWTAAGGSGVCFVAGSRNRLPSILVADLGDHNTPSQQATLGRSWRAVPVLRPSLRVEGGRGRGVALFPHPTEYPTVPLKSAPGSPE